MFPDMAFAATGVFLNDVACAADAIFSPAVPSSWAQCKKFFPYTIIYI